MSNAGIVIRALLLAVGATEDEVEPAYRVLRPLQVPSTPAGALEQARAALASVR